MTSPLSSASRVVVKVGSALIAGRAGASVDTGRLADLARDMAGLWARGCACVLVSSGAVAVGRARLEDAGRALVDKQALAAVGQAELMQAWARAFEAEDRRVAQALLTLEDTERRRRWLNARATLERLLAWGVTPIINENDTVATDEIRYGDNDRLAARIAQMIGADVLVLLSDVDGLYTADPRLAQDARRIDHVPVITPEIDALAGPSSSDHGSGGMRSKLEAARIAVDGGCRVAIAPGALEAPLSALAAGGAATWFDAPHDPLTARKRWIAGALKPAGAVAIDTGAAAALATGKSLLPAGVTGVTGAFEKGDAVRITGEDGREIARGLIAYAAEDARAIIGRRSEDIEAVLGYAGPTALIHRNDLVMDPAKETDA